MVPMLNRFKIVLPIQTPAIVVREITYPRRDLWILLAVCGFMRLVMSPVNEAEYTDGVLQVMQFVDPNGIWPPLYGALTYVLKFVFGYLWGGRLVSVLAGTLALYPIYRLTQRAFGTRAALYAGIFYITAPIAMRWGVRMMSDMTFAMFFWWTCERLYFASDERCEDVARRAFGAACVLAVFASLTRYQGVMLLPPIAVFAWLLKRRFGRWPIRPALWLLGLAVLALWVSLTSDTFIHDDQFRARAIQSPTMALGKVLALNAEAFVAFTAYFLVYPVAVFALIGIFWTRMRRGVSFGWLMLYIAAVLLVVQSAFSSFQERYFLPLFGFFWVLAGSGMYALEERWLRRGVAWKARLFPYVLILTYLWSAGFGLFSLVGQRHVFGDIAEASRYAGELTPPGQPIYTNELYRDNPPITGAKVAFFADRPAVFLDETYVAFQGTRGGVLPRPPRRRIPPGSIVVLSSLYDGERYANYIERYYRVTPLGIDSSGETIFQARALPLLPDVMSGFPGGQNPLAWHFRYDWQEFRTWVYRIEGPQ